MATIDIRQEHHLSKEEAKQRAEKLAQGMKEKIGIVWHWQGDVIHFDAPTGAAKGATGEVDVTDKSVRVQIDLPFLLRILKGKIEDRVRAQLNTLL